MISESLSHYRIIKKLDAGGMGEVYLAQDTKLDRKVALKILPAEVAADRGRMSRFVQEAKAASALNHPNILTIYEIDQADSVHFIATEFIDGETLRQRMKNAPLKLRDVLEVSAQIAIALSAAHAAGIVHRDIKPENVMLRRDGIVKVLDFGLAKLTERLLPDSVDTEAPTSFKTDPGTVVGTAVYMSPEQARGLQVDARTDIFSLGVLVYEMVAGRLPFEGSNQNEIVASILSDKDSQPLTRYSREAPTELERIVEKALRKDREERYQTSKDLLIDLKRLQQSLQIKARFDSGKSPDEQEEPRLDQAFSTQPGAAKPSSAEYVVNQLKRHKLVALLLVIFLFATGVVVYLWRWRQATVFAQPPISSIAVMPLVNSASDSDTEFISDGITDNLIERLSQLPNLRVMSHSAVFHYKGRQTDPRTIGSELGVEAVLTGRLVKRNDAITISLELVNAKDNSHIWGERYDRKLSELLVLQREIPFDVSDKLRLKLSGESKERLTRVYTSNAEAYQLYLKGRHAWATWTLEGAKQAVAFFEEAIKKDPNYALAYAGLADVYLFGRFAGAGLPQKEAHRRGREAATKALSIDPQLGEAHAALSKVLLYDDWDFAGAERELKRALELNPSDGEAHHAYSHLLLLLGRIDESLVESKKYLEVDPVSESPIGHICYHSLYARQYDDAITQCRKAITYSDSPQGYTLADAYYQKGMFREAVEEFLKAFARDGSPPDKIAAFREAFAKAGMVGFWRHWLEQRKSKPPNEQSYVDIAELHARLGEKDQAFEWLEKAYATHADGLLRLKEELGFDSLRSDSRYADLLRRIGLPSRQAVGFRRSQKAIFMLTS